MKDVISEEFKKEFPKLQCLINDYIASNPILGGMKLAHLSLKITPVHNELSPLTLETHAEMLNNLGHAFRICGEEPDLIQEC